MRFTLLLFTIILCLNSALSTLASAAKFAHANDSLNENSLVICTGSQVKIISSYHYFELGQVLELETLEVEAELADISCPLDNSLEPSAVLTTIANTAKAQKISFHRLYVSLQQSLLSFERYNSALSRAPPNSNLNINF